MYISGLGQTIWADKFWSIWGIFGQFISTHFGTVNPLSMFFINQLLYLQKISFYIPIPNIYLGLGFEFGRKELGIYPSCVHSSCLQVFLSPQLKIQKRVPFIGNNRTTQAQWIQIIYKVVSKILDTVPNNSFCF